MQAVSQHRKNIEVTEQTKHFINFWRVLLIALTIRINVYLVLSIADFCHQLEAVHNTTKLHLT